jgi:hypothetical protein
MNNFECYKQAHLQREAGRQEGDRQAGRLLVGQLRTYEPLYPIPTTTLIKLTSGSFTSLHFTSLQLFR